MKILIIFFSFLLLLTSLSYAHPPVSMEAQYIAPEDALIVTVHHPVVNVRRHKIGLIEVRKNGNLIAKRKFVAQTNRVMHKAVIPLEGVKPGDTLEIQAYCNINGSLRKILNVQDIKVPSKKK